MAARENGVSRLDEDGPELAEMVVEGHRDCAREFFDDHSARAIGETPLLVAKPPKDHPSSFNLLGRQTVDGRHVATKEAFTEGNRSLAFATRPQ